MERARGWAGAEPSLAAAIAYGSLARGKGTEFSDLDLVLVARPGERERLWQERRDIAARILGSTVAWGWELDWQRPFRYQAWRADLAMVDLTFDEGEAHVWEGVAAGFDVLVDRDGVGERLRDAVAAWSPPPLDAQALDQGTWPLFYWLSGRLRSGDYWFVRAGVHELLSRRVIPLFGTTPVSVERELVDKDLAAIRHAAPASSEPAELARALLATLDLYERALDRWAERAGAERPHHALAEAVGRRIASLGDEG